MCHEGRAHDAERDLAVEVEPQEEQHGRGGGLMARGNAPWRGGMAEAFKRKWRKFRFCIAFLGE